MLIREGGIVITGGVEGVSVTGADWAATSGTVSTILIAGQIGGVSIDVSEAVANLSSGSFSADSLTSSIPNLAAVIDSVAFCGIAGEQDDLLVNVPTSSVVKRVWALVCEGNCGEYLAADEVSGLEGADHVLELNDGQIIPIIVDVEDGE